MPRTLLQNINKRRESFGREKIDDVRRSCGKCDREVPISELYWYKRQAWWCNNCHPDV